MRAHHLCVCVGGGGGGAGRGRSEPFSTELFSSVCKDKIEKDIIILFI